MFQNKKNNKAKGDWGEELARKLLVQKGHRIHAINWRYGRIELDIISEYQDIIVFTEVKLRHPETLQEPQLAVNRKKQKLIVKAADAWLKAQDISAEARFDIVSVWHIPGRPALTEHIEGAYYPFM